MRILLTGTRAPVALDLARAFRACGHEVHGADSLRSAVLGGALDSFSLCASPRRQPEAFARDADRIVNAIRPGLVISLCEDIFYWSRLAESHGWPIFAPGLPVLMRLHSKFAFIELAHKLGLAAPPTHRISKKKDELNTDRSVFKREFSRFGTHVFIRPKSLPRLDHDPVNPWLRQDFIAGEDVCFYAVARAGRLRAFSAYRSSWRTSGGASYYFDPIGEALNQQLMNIANALIHILDLTGQIACDLRLDHDGQPWLVECNPRATSGLHLLADNPQALTAAFLREDGEVLKASSQPACVGPAMILSGLPKAIARGRLSAWQKDMHRARDVFAGVRWPAFCGAISWMTLAALAGQDLQTFLTADMECNRDLTCG